MLVLIITDLCMKYKNYLIEYVFIAILMIEGSVLIIESTFPAEYRFHEIWLVFYCKFVLISISCCFHWKRIVLVFWVIQVCNFVTLHLKYNNISVYFYTGYIFIFILLPLVSMVIARIVLAFMMLAHNNQDLTKTIKQILEVFPQGIIIQSIDKVTQHLIVKYVNKTSAKEILSYSDPSDKPINDSLLKYKLKDNDTFEKNLLSNNIAKPKNLKLSELLRFHSETVEAGEISTKNCIEIRHHESKQIEQKIKFYDVKTLPVKWENNGNSFIHIFNDTTTLKKFEAEKVRNECIQLMLSSVSHEFRTPINAFSNSMMLIETNYNNLKKNLNEKVNTGIKSDILSRHISEANDKYFKICKVSTTSLMCLVEDILDLAKIEAGTFRLVNKPFCVETLVNEIGYIFEFQCAQKGILFKVDISKELSESYFCSDIGRIKQVLINLISNAFKFTMRGSITLQIKESLKFVQESFERHKGLKFKVIDTGVGIDEKEIPKLFKLFGTASKHSSMNSRGTGLGLSLYFSENRQKSWWFNKTEIEACRRHKS